MGASRLRVHTNSLKTVYFNTTSYYSPFRTTLYRCFDPNCLTCTFDNLAGGSKLCTVCASGFTFKPEIQECVSDLCGNGVLNGTEICDSGPTLFGCLVNCKGIKANFTCSGLTSSSPSLCSCIADHTLNSTLGSCLPTCGNGKKQTGEGCDAGTNPGCLPDCSGPR
jgi:hypothetical protein